MDIYALSHKFPNIYQLIGTDSFLFEYADAGIWVTLGALMILMYCFARKQYEMNACLLLRMGMLLTMTVVFFLPHMHERYAILVDVMAIVYVFLISENSIYRYLRSCVLLQDIQSIWHRITSFRCMCIQSCSCF